VIGTLSDATVLVVDDAPENVRVLGTALRGQCRVRAATCGRDALAIAKGENPPDLILLDIMMPGMDGYEVCRLLHEDPDTVEIPVIFITAMDEVEDETRGLDAGAVDYIAKPFSSAIVRARVRTHLELKRHRDELRNLSNLDGLTGIPNRRRFDEVLGLEWRRAVRSSHSISLLIIDIDHFKNYNDTFGHPTGDDCLREVAATLRGCALRSSDFVGRYGGEEFAAILPNTSAEGAATMAERMREAVDQLLLGEETDPTGPRGVTVSIGGATAAASFQGDPLKLVERADRQLYRAKDAGRNRVFLDDAESA